MVRSFWIIIIILPFLKNFKGQVNLSVGGVNNLYINKELCYLNSARVIPFETLETLDSMTTSRDDESRIQTT